MDVVKVKDGYKILSDSGKIFPKVYKSKASVKKRMDELERHAAPVEKKKK